VLCRSPRLTNHWTGAAESAFRIKLDPAKLLGCAPPGQLNRYVAHLMKRKILTFLVIVVALIYLALAANFIYQYREVARVLISYGVPPAEFNSFEEIVSLRRTFLGAAIVCSFLGLLTLSVGTSLYLGKQWAERAWLILTILLPCVHLIRLVAVFGLGAFWITERTIELTLVTALAVFSWKVLCTPRGKQPLSATAT
jgi:cytochrome c biogenesis protein CcdA